MVSRTALSLDLFVLIWNTLKNTSRKYFTFSPADDTQIFKYFDPEDFPLAFSQLQRDVSTIIFHDFLKISPFTIKLILRLNSFILVRLFFISGYIHNFIQPCTSACNLGLIFVLSLIQQRKSPNFQHMSLITFEVSDAYMKMRWQQS